MFVFWSIKNVYQSFCSSMSLDRNLSPSDHYAQWLYLQWLLAGLCAASAFFHAATHGISAHAWTPYVLVCESVYALTFLASCALLRFDHRSNLGPGFFLYCFWSVAVLRNLLQGLSWKNGDWFRYVWSAVGEEEERGGGGGGF